MTLVQGVRSGRDAPASPAHGHGLLHAEFDARGGRTVLARLATRPPLQALRPLYPLNVGGPAELQVATLGPGLMGGDHHQIEVAAGAGTRVQVTTQSATRLLPVRGGLPAVAEVRLLVDDGACLTWRPLPTILQAEAAYQQTIDVTVAEGATAFVWDVLVPGRLARGERFAFAELDARLRVRSTERRTLVAERLRCRPGEDDPRSPAAMPEPDVVLGSLWVLAPGCPIALPEVELEPNTGLTELPNGAGLHIRTVAPTAQIATGRLERTLALVNPAGGTP